MKQKIRLTERDLHRIIRNCVNEATKKDPMKQWFKEMENASEYRERMDYITKGGGQFQENQMEKLMKKRIFQLSTRKDFANL